MAKIYVTKYALSSGVFTTEAELVGAYAHGHRGWRDVWGQKEFALTEEQAMKQFDAKVAKRIASLRRQIEKLESLKFTVKERAP